MTRDRRLLAARLEREDLTQKLPDFPIVFAAAFIIVAAFRALGSIAVPGLWWPGAFMTFFASNMLLFGFMMVVSLCYTAYSLLGWRVACVCLTLLLIPSWPRAVRLIVGSNPSLAVGLVVVIILSLAALKRKSNLLKRWGSGSQKPANATTTRTKNEKDLRNT